MAKNPEPESQVIQQARAELRIAAEELQGVSLRLVAMIDCLKAGSQTAEVLGKDPGTGKALTPEGWGAGVLSDFLEAVEELVARTQREAECDWRVEVEEYVAGMVTEKEVSEP